MNHGARPTCLSHTDYDFFKNHKFGVAVKPTIPNEYFADAGLLNPNQEITDTEFTPPTPPMPFGCTNFAQAGLATDLTKQIHNPNDLEAVTHANARGGIDIRESLDGAVKLGWIKSYFNVRPTGMYDWFESMQLSQVVGLAAGENRSLSVGYPWFSSWEQAALAGTKIMPMPTDTELAAIRKDSNAFPWHNPKDDGFTSINGRLVYRCFSWQGNIVDPVNFPREVINMVMTIPGTVAYTASNLQMNNPLPIDLSTIQWILSFCRNLLKKYGII